LKCADLGSAVNMCFNWRSFSLSHSILLTLDIHFTFFLAEADPGLNSSPSFVFSSYFDKNFRIGFPHKTFILPGSFLWTKVLPLHFNLGDGSFPEHDFPPVYYTVGLDQKFSVRFYLHTINLN